MIEAHEKDPAQRSLQKRLAKEIATFVHGEEGFNNAIETTEKLFADQNAPAESLSEEDLESMQGVINFNVDSKIIQGIDVVSFLSGANIFPSKSEARKMIQNGGVSINRKKISDVQMIIDSSLLLHKKYLLVQKGKKNYYLGKLA